MKKVLLVDPIAQEGIALMEHAGFEVRALTDRSHEHILKEVVDKDAILVRTTFITEDIIEAGSKLRVIARHGVGYDNIDVGAAAKRGIVVTNSPMANLVAVAEHVIGMMIVLAKNMRKADIALRQGQFSARNVYIGQELEGKTLGLVGLGRIGQRVGQIAMNGLGMRVLGYDPYIPKSAIPQGFAYTDSWEEIFSKPDFVSLHLPLIESTKGLIGMREFSLMKKNAIFINCARGPIVVEADLVAALKNNVILAAGLDVFETEPPASDNPLFTLDNVLVTPHMAAHSKEAMVKMAVHAAQGIVEVLSGKNPTWKVTA